MILAHLIALALAAAAAAPAAASGGAASAPLREVVYKVTFTRMLEISNETYGGQIQNTQLTQAAQAPPFAQANSNAGDTGTVTVDIMQVANDVLGIRVFEKWNGSTPSAMYQGNVGSDGSVNFTNGQMNECTRAILEYMGADVMDGQAANSGVGWTRTERGQAADITTTYAVGDIVGAIANIHEQTTVTSKSVALIDSTTTTDVQYKPAMLVAVSGKLVMHASRSSASSVTRVTTIGHFERVSDTRDSGS